MNAFRASVVLGLIACFSTDLSAREVRWERDLKLAASKSVKSHKPMLLRFTVSWCGYCKKMLATTFRDDRVVEQISGCFIPVEVDGEANPQLGKTLGVTGYPTTVIISPKLKVVKTIVGYQSAAALRRQLGGLCPRRGPSATVAHTKTKVESAREAAPQFGGYCLVSMLDDHKLIRGVSEYSVQYRGATFWFATDAHKRTFQADPTKYQPVNDGLCPVAETDGHVRQAGRPQNAVIYRGRLWFLARKDDRKTFASNPRRYAKVQTARRN
ncbi:MAG: thioredoxin fold domain-containing protein [Planctomycetaceae bacterium]